tara:strand:- start:240 stop:425 length:186 start_codon:yes stop_codon:yes gene_type:complete
MKIFQVGDKVKHNNRVGYYQKGVVTEIEEGCNGRIKVLWEDDFYGGSGEGYFCKLDLMERK